MNDMKNKNACLIFSNTFVRNIFHSEKNWARYDHKRILTFMQTAQYSCQVLMKVQFSLRIFEKYSYQILWKSVEWKPGSMWTEERTDGQTDRHDMTWYDTTKVIVAVSSFADEPKNSCIGRWRDSTKTTSSVFYATPHPITSMWRRITQL